MAIMIGSARIDESGKATGGAAGDQKQTSSTNDTAGEVSMQSMYTHSKGWYILRPTSVSVANKLAELMKTACNNSHIGYDQGGRLGIISCGIATTTDTECDCSSLVRECVREATGTDAGNFTTANEATKLKATGLFEDKVAYVSQSKTPVYNGDILVTKTKGHTVIVVSGNPRSGDSTSGSSAASTSTKAAASSTAAPKTVWDYLLGKIGNAYGVAGLMGNLYAESGLVPNNLQNSYQSKLGMTDAEYTAAVDDGSYTAFASDSAGYGLAQWTYSTRKKNLKAYADAQNASIGNLSMQLGFLHKELSESYSAVLTTLKNAASVLEASNAVLLKFEKPANTSTSVQTKRAEYGQKYYDSYAGTSTGSSTSSGETATATGAKTATDKAAKFDKTLAGTYKVTASALNIRNGAGTGKALMATIPKGTEVKCYGYYSTASGVKWLYIQFTYNGTVYTGFANATYLAKA